jgi:heterodisulfide reductase subunit C
VEAADDPARELDLTPQQIMNLLRLQMTDEALGARMVWNCVTCYMCQEHCPQGVKVADVLYELRNIAYRRFYPGKVHNRHSRPIPHHPEKESREAVP